MINDLLMNIIAGFIGAFLGWAGKAFYNRKKYSVFRFVRRFKVFHSGAQGYYYSFPPEDNKKAWEEVEHKFCYLGISTNTFNNELLDFMNSEKGKSIDYEFLLMNPGKPEFIEKQEAYKYGYKDITSADEVERMKIRQQVEITIKNITNSVEKIKNTDVFNKRNVEIRYFEEFLPWWIYIFDDNKVYVGLLEFGKDGRKCPLVVLEKKDKYFTLFDAFLTNWKRLWGDKASENEQPLN